MDKKGFLEEAKRLIDLPQSCMKKEDTSVMLLVHPKHATNVKKGIIEELDAMLQRYSETLNGIPMAYENIKLLSNYGVLLHDNAYAHVHIFASFYVFTPEIGSVIPGVVVKKSKNHIGLLVYNKFNVSAICPDGLSIANWCGSQVEEQDEVKVTVTYLYMKGYVPTIKVKINPDSIPERTSPSMEIATNTENKRTVFNDDDSGISSNDTPVTEVKKKKKKSRIEDKLDSKVKDDDLSSEDDTENKKKPNKTLFKNIKSENSDLDSSESKDILTPDSLLDPSTKKKKKKRKRSLEESQDSPTPSTDRPDDSFRDEGDGSFVSPPSKKKKREKAIKMESDSPAIDLGNDSSFVTPVRKSKIGNLDSQKLDLNGSTLSSPAKKKKNKKSKDDSFSMGDLNNDNSMLTPISKNKKENSDSPELDLNVSTLSPAKKKDKKSKDNSFSPGDLKNDTSMTTPIRKSKKDHFDLSKQDLKDSTLLSPMKKKKNSEKSKDNSFSINSFDTPKNINITPVIKKEPEISSPKSSKKAKKSLANDDLSDLPFDFDDDMFASPPAKVKKENKNKTESQSSQSPQIKDKKRKAEETPDGSKPKKKRKN